MLRATTDPVEALQSLVSDGMAGGAGLEAVTHRVDEQRQARDALHRQQQEGRHRQTLALGVLLEATHGLHVLGSLPTTQHSPTHGYRNIQQATF